MSKNTVGLTILEQLGGRQFILMTGASHLGTTGNNLFFKLPGRPGFVRDSINHVDILLTPADTYTITFSRVRGMKIKTVKQHEDIYAEDLRQIFRDTTGLETRMPQFRRSAA